MNFTTTEIVYMVFLAASTYAGLQLNQQHRALSIPLRFSVFTSFFSANYLIKQFAGPFNLYVYGAVAVAFIVSIISTFFGADTPK